ncbi:MAG: hypothetical protein WKG01_34170 [Kofleriaceae bacterium]
MRSAVLVLVLIGCGGPTRLAGEAVVTVSDVTGGAAVPEDELVWIGVLAYGFGADGGDITESALVGVAPDPCDLRLDIRFAGEPRSQTIELPDGGTIFVRRGGGSQCPRDPEMRWGSTTGTLAVTLDGELVTAAFSGVAMAPRMIPGMAANAAPGGFPIAGSAAAIDYG